MGLYSEERASKPRAHKVKVVYFCQVDGCKSKLSNCKPYCVRYRVCPAHLAAESVQLQGVDSRFCQQCGKFHPLEEFDGTKRSCRTRLMHHNNSRQQRRKEAALQASVSTSLMLAHRGARQTAARRRYAGLDGGDNSGNSNSCNSSDAEGGGGGGRGQSGSSYGSARQQPRKQQQHQRELSRAGQPHRQRGPVEPWDAEFGGGVGADLASMWASSMAVHPAALGPGHPMHGMAGAHCAPWEQQQQQQQQHHHHHRQTHTHHQPQQHLACDAYDRCCTQQHAPPPPPPPPAYLAASGATQLHPAPAACPSRIAGAAPPGAACYASVAWEVEQQLQQQQRWAAPKLESGPHSATASPCSGQHALTQKFGGLAGGIAAAAAAAAGTAHGSGVHVLAASGQGPAALAASLALASAAGPGTAEQQGMLAHFDSACSGYFDYALDGEPKQVGSGRPATDAAAAPAERCGPPQSLASAGTAFAAGSEHGGFTAGPFGHGSDSHHGMGAPGLSAGMLGAGAAPLPARGPGCCTVPGCTLPGCMGEPAPLPGYTPAPPWDAGRGGGAHAGAPATPRTCDIAASLGAAGHPGGSCSPQGGTSVSSYGSSWASSGHLASWPGPGAHGHWPHQQHHQQPQHPSHHHSHFLQPPAFSDGPGAGHLQVQAVDGGGQGSRRQHWRQQQRWPGGPNGTCSSLPATPPDMSGRACCPQERQHPCSHPAGAALAARGPAPYNEPAPGVGGHPSGYASCEAAAAQYVCAGAAPGPLARRLSSASDLSPNCSSFTMAPAPTQQQQPQQQQAPFSQAPGSASVDAAGPLAAPPRAPSMLSFSSGPPMQQQGQHGQWESSRRAVDPAPGAEPGCLPPSGPVKAVHGACSAAAPLAQASAVSALGLSRHMSLPDCSLPPQQLQAAAVASAVLERLPGRVSFGGDGGSSGDGTCCGPAGSALHRCKSLPSVQERGGVQLQQLAAAPRLAAHACGSGHRAEDAAALPALEQLGGWHGREVAAAGGDAAHSVGRLQPQSSGRFDGAPRGSLGGEPLHSQWHAGGTHGAECGQRWPVGQAPGGAVGEPQQQRQQLAAHDQGHGATQAGAPPHGGACALSASVSALAHDMLGSCKGLDELLRWAEAGDHHQVDLV